jgi:prevent-host-death family protein
VFVQAHSTNLKGAVAELKIAAAAAELGVSVLQPMTEHGRYDLVFEIAGRFLRVQCKWAPREGDVVVVRLSGYRIGTKGRIRTKYQAGEIDAVAAYCGDLDRVYLLPAQRVIGATAIQLRLAPPRNGQRAALNWAAEFELPGAVAQLEERVAGSHEAGGSSPPSSTPSQGATEVGAHEFRNHFGYYMERAAAGDEIRVSRRGRPYVRLVPEPGPRQASLELAAGTARRPTCGTSRRRPHPAASAAIRAATAGA